MMSNPFKSKSLNGILGVFHKAHDDLQEYIVDKNGKLEQARIDLSEHQAYLDTALKVNTNLKTLLGR